MLRRAYDPIIYPLDTDYVVINMEQHETTEQKQEQASRIGWTEGQPRNFTQFSMEISRARNKLHNDIYDSEDKGGLGFSSPYFISRLQVLEEIYQMLQEVE